MTEKNYKRNEVKSDIFAVKAMTREKRNLLKRNKFLRKIVATGRFASCFSSTGYVFFLCVIIFVAWTLSRDVPDQLEFVLRLRHCWSSQTT